MVDRIQRKIPEYLDDRFTIKVLLSDDFRYHRYSYVQVPGTISAWIDGGTAYSTTSSEYIPHDGRPVMRLSNSSSVSPNSLAYPQTGHFIPISSGQEDTNVYSCDTGTRFRFLQKPEFSGDVLKIWWDCDDPEENPPEIFTMSSQLSDYSHDYGRYGTFRIKISTNLSAISFNQGSGGYPTGIVEIESRNGELKSLRGIQMCWGLRNLKAYGIREIKNECYDCYDLSSVSLPDLETITEPYALNYMFNLVDFDFPKLSSITECTGVFKGNQKIPEYRFPKLSHIPEIKNNYPFQSSMAVSSIYLPELVNVVKSSFDCCINLKQVVLDSAERIGTTGFRCCISLEKIRLPKVKTIMNQAFLSCISLREIDISNVRQVPVLNNVNAFAGLPADYKVKINKDISGDYLANATWKNIASHLSAV